MQSLFPLSPLALDSLILTKRINKTISQDIFLDTVMTIPQPSNFLVQIWHPNPHTYPPPPHNPRSYLVSLHSQSLFF